MVDRSNQVEDVHKRLYVGSRDQGHIGQVVDHTHEHTVFVLGSSHRIVVAEDILEEEGSLCSAGCYAYPSAAPDAAPSSQSSAPPAPDYLPATASPKSARPGRLTS